MIEAAEGTLEPEPIPSLQYTDDIGLMTLYKWMRDIVRWRSCLLHKLLLPDGRCLVSFLRMVFTLVAALPRWVHLWLD
jgi:hypothetical protein